MAGWDMENITTVAILAALTMIYLYLLLSPTQPRLPQKLINVVIKRDTIQNFKEFMQGGSDYSEEYKKYTSNEFQYDDEMNTTERYDHHREDDFFLDPSEFKDYDPSKEEDEEDDDIPIVPSLKYICQPNTWLTIRSELNYKYLWMHGTEDMWMGASATIDTPIHRKAFIMHPLDLDCNKTGGWVLLQEGDSDHFIRMVSPNDSTHLTYDAWVIRLGTNNISEALESPSYHFLVESDGFLLNRGTMAFINVLAETDYPVRGHSGGWRRNKPAKREFGSTFKFNLINQTYIFESIAKENKDIQKSNEDDLKLIKKIKKFSNTNHEKRVIAFGLYGSRDKYNIGAIHNAELVNTYFPGWICRFYVTSDVPNATITSLKLLGSEIEEIPSGMGYTSGMFWRFMVADDPTVDRYIIRDSDSRLNARDRMAVEEWIRSGYDIHILRDHVNHCLVMNGGMWGGVKGAIKNMKQKILDWQNRNEYMADLHFLEKEVWPDIKYNQIAHDSYCCDRYPNTRPFPTKRYLTYQHVGQVFNEHDEARLTDIDGWIRGVPTPSSCRKNPNWIYG